MVEAIRSVGDSGTCWVWSPSMIDGTWMIWRQIEEHLGGNITTNSEVLLTNADTGSHRGCDNKADSAGTYKRTAADFEHEIRMRPKPLADNRQSVGECGK